MQNRHRGGGHRGSGISSHGSGSSVAVAVARMGSREGVASGQGVGSVPSWMMQAGRQAGRQAARQAGSQAGSQAVTHRR